ncbi:MAG TPA: hypothetical protein VF941_05055 [Clostridia bacterium]
MKRLIYILVLFAFLCGCGANIPTDNSTVKEQSSILTAVPSIEPAEEPTQAPTPKPTQAPELTKKPSESVGLKKDSEQATIKSNDVPKAVPDNTIKPENKEPEQKEVTVYVTRTGKKYHRAGCRYLSRSEIPISLKDAEAEGYTPCSVCHPPQ